MTGWHEVLATIEQGAPLVYPGEAGDVAQAARWIALDRQGRVLIPKPLKGTSMCEWKATLGSHATAWCAKGAQAILNLDVKPGETAWVSPRGAVCGDGGAPTKPIHLVCASLTPDVTGREAIRLTDYWIKKQAPYLLVDDPREANVIEALQVWHRRGEVHQWNVVTSWYGDRTARNRSITVVAAGAHFNAKAFAELVTP